VPLPHRATASLVNALGSRKPLLRQRDPRVITQSIFLVVKDHPDSRVSEELGRARITQFCAPQWQADDFWQYAMYTAVACISSAASRAGVPVRQACQELNERRPRNQVLPITSTPAQSAVFSCTRAG
jgi:hypothetical protein